ncbi:MAG: type II toxin-antitoxin system VapC family toxin [Candidatus Aminicenantes bacterium]|nr:type II toxin-antitoxin system VapC family toxin [Candidatus Aminicenantes bacterium]
MAKFFLDTGILLGYIRGADYAKYAEKKFELTSPTNISLISIVTIGEIYSLAAQFQWGDKKKKVLQKTLEAVQAIDISYPQVLERYAEIDAFSQGRHASRKLPNGMSSRNMGKNDLWIAATASILNAKLLTTDKDFDHLNKEFLEIICIDPNGDYKREF